MQTNVCSRAKGVQSVDVVREEMVEKELDRLIERRSRQKYPDEESELCRESVRAYDEKHWQMARLTPELSGHYVRDFDLGDLIKELTPPPSAVESDAPAGNTTTVIGVQIRQTIAGVTRGTVEHVLAELANLGAEVKPTPSSEPEA
jgi:peptide subunit release factor RF-3